MVIKCKEKVNLEKFNPNTLKDLFSKVTLPVKDVDGEKIELIVKREGNGRLAEYVVTDAGHAMVKLSDKGVDLYKETERVRNIAKAYGVTVDPSGLLWKQASKEDLVDVFMDVAQVYNGTLCMFA